MKTMTGSYFDEILGSQLGILDPYGLIGQVSLNLDNLFGNNNMKPSLKKSIFSLALGTGLLASATWSTASHACAVEPYIGSVCIMAWPRSNSFGDNTYISASGQTMTISQNQALYAILGTTYGGDGKTNFKLPDLRGRVVVGAGTAPFNNTVYRNGTAGGSPTVTLNSSNLPKHSHTVISSGTGTATTVLSGEPSGGGAATPVSVMQPYLPMSYYIAVTGEFPSID